MSVGDGVARCTIGWALLFLLLAAATPAWAAKLDPGLSAMWFDPERSGEGWVLEVIDGDRALLYWYTYDEQGNQRWLQGLGDRVADDTGDALVFAELYVTRGPSFGPNFDPEEVEIEVVGEAMLRFDGCDRGQFTYAAFDQAETLDLQRLSQTMAAGCSPINGEPGQAIQAYAGQSGSWFDLDRSGEGFSIHWLSRGQALVTWFTYDSQGAQRWLIGVGDRQDGKIVLPALQSTRGARFGSEFDPDDVERLDWGGMELELNCSTGTATFDSVQPEPMPERFDLTRLTRIAGLPCPWTAPELSDLYDLTWEEVPLPASGLITAASIADDGTIAGVESSDTLTRMPYFLVLHRPGSGLWQRVPGEIMSTPIISPDGLRVLSSAIDGTEQHPIMWQQPNGWQRLPGMALDDSIVYGVSQDLSRLVGLARSAGDGRDDPWIWDPVEGQRQLPLSEDAPFAVPLAVANDGTTVVGNASLLMINYDFGAGLEWVDGRAPEALFNDRSERLGGALLCNYDCSVTAGTGLAGMFSPDRRAWVKTQDGHFVYLEELPDAPAGQTTYTPRAMTSDGRLLSGSYHYFDDAIPDQGSPLIRRAFVWTQRTGTVSLSALLEANGIANDRWRNVTAWSLSSSGDRILVLAWVDTEQPWVTRPRALVLSLSPRSGE